jgi:aspartyl aminopeptidase
MPAMTDRADDLVDYLNASPTPWHAVTETVHRLAAAGFRELAEEDEWHVTPGDKVFVVRAGSTVAAFEIGEASLDASGVRAVGAHTDSPNLRVKPNASLKRHGQHQIGVEVYGGVLLHTWLDRDLALAGRVLVRDGSAIGSKLVRFPRAIGRVPSLAIHLDRAVNTEGLVVNPQTQLPPVLALESTGPLDLREELAAQLEKQGEKVLASAIVGHDLCFFDAQPSARIGLRDDYVCSGRLDNLASCHASLCALIAAPPAPHTTRGIVLYDHEECGSQSAQGAQSPFLRTILERLALAHPSAGSSPVHRMLARSFVISADMAHAIHPNYADKHEPNHQPLLGGGPVIKSNSNQRYATDGESAARFEMWCEQAGVKPQRFVTRTDLACGTTIGPITAAMTGVRVVDVGNPMLSMHSSRETCAAADVGKMIDVLAAFFSARA